MADDADVVGDEEVGEAELVLQVGEQVDDLRLDRDVEGGDRLVGDDQLRLQRQGAGDPDPLALAAGELVRVAVVVLGGEADPLEQLLDAASQLAPEAPSLAGCSGSPTICADALARVERGDRGPGRSSASRGAGAASAAARGRRSRGPRSDRARGRLEQLQDRSGTRVDLPLPDSPTRPSVSPPADAEADPVDGPHPVDLAVDQQAALDREVLDQVGDLEQRLALLTPAPPARSDPRRRGARASAPASASSGRGGPAPRSGRDSSGGSSAQRSKACGQRGRKAQPPAKVEQRGRRAAGSAAAAAGGAASIRVSEPSRPQV